MHYEEERPVGSRHVARKTVAYSDFGLRLLSLPQCAKRTRIEPGELALGQTTSSVDLDWSGGDLRSLLSAMT